MTTGARLYALFLADEPPCRRVSQLAKLHEAGRVTDSERDALTDLIALAQREEVDRAMTCSDRGGHVYEYGRCFRCGAPR